MKAQLIRWYPSLASMIVGRMPAQLPDDPVKWQTLAALARAERVEPLLDHALRAFPAVEAAMPAAVRERLASAYHTATAASMLHEAVRKRVCAELAQRAIPVMLLKGAALAFTCYEDPVTRPMSDLDLLVPESRLKEAAQALEELDFVPQLPPRSFIPALNRPRSHHVYVHSSHHTIVELHWDVEALRGVGAAEYAEIWSHAQRLNQETDAQVMRRGHLIPLLCAHMTLQHKEASLLWLYDLHRVLLTSDAADAVLARETAARWRLGPCTALALRRVQELFGAALPEPLDAWVPQTTAQRGLQARIAALALEPGTPRMPHVELVNLLTLRDVRLLRSLFLTPDGLRQWLDLPPDQSVGAAYVAFLWQRMRKTPAHFWRLWRSWLASSSLPRPHAPLRRSGKDRTQ